jgi:hypothetical protein
MIELTEDDFDAALNVGFVMLQLFEFEEIKEIIMTRMSKDTGISEEKLNEMLGNFVMQDKETTDNDKIEILKDLGQI